MTLPRYIHNPKMFVALCALSLLFLSPIGGGLTIIGSVLVITWPLVFIMFAAPLIVMFWAFTKAIRKLGLNPWAAGALALLLLAIPPFITNEQSRSRIEALRASDLDALGPPESIATLGLILSPNWREEDTNICGELCMRLLLNGEVDRIAVSTPPAIGDPINWGQVATVYSMQPKDGCQNVETGYNQLSIDVSGRRSTADRNEVEAALLAQQAIGNCLTKDQMPIGSADAVIYYTTLKDGPDIYEAGLDYFADTIKAQRLAYYQHSAGGMELQYQLTFASYTKHFPLFAFSQNVLANGSFASKLGFLGWERYFGGDRDHGLAINPMPLLRARLGLKLEVPQVDTFQISMQEIANTLASEGRLSPTKVALMASFLESFVRASERSLPQAELALQIWKDPRVQFSRSAAMAARAISNAFPQLEPRVAEVLFSRLTNVESDYNTKAVKTRQRIAAATALSELRTPALAPYFEQIELLSTRVDTGTTALPLIARLGDFGAAGIPPLLGVLDRAGLLPDGSRFQAGSNWARTYEAAINGLCRAAFSADPAINRAEVRAALESRLHAGVIVNRSDNQISTLGMLLAFGVDQETLWPVFRNATATQARARFLQNIRIATARPGCPTTPRP